MTVELLQCGSCGRRLELGSPYRGIIFLPIARSEGNSQRA